MSDDGSRTSQAGQAVFSGGKVGLILPFLLILGVGVWLRLDLFAYYITENDVPSYLFAAETFASGRLTVPVPEPDNPATRLSDEAPQFFRTFMVVPHTFNDLQADGTRYNRMYTRYPPGHPLVLFLCKTLLGAYTFVPVLIMLLGAGAVYCILRVSEDETTARAGLWLMAASPFYLAFGSALTSHNSTFLMLALGVLMYVLMDRQPKGRWKIVCGFLAAFFFGWAVACRPMTGLCAILAIVLWEFGRLFRRRQRIVLRWLPMLLGGLLAGAGLLWYNAEVTGAPFRLAFTQYWPRDKPGFTGWTERDISHWTASEKEAHLESFVGEDVLGHDKLRYLQHTPFRAIMKTFAMIGEFDSHSLVLPGGVLLLFLGFAAGWRGRSGYTELYAVMAFMMMLGYVPYFGEGRHGWGPRYYYEILLPFFLLMAPVAVQIAQHVKTLGRQRGVIMVALFVLAVAHVVSVHTPVYELQRAYHEKRSHIADAIRDTVADPAIVFLPPPIPGDLAGQFWYVGYKHTHLLNAPTFDGPILYAVNNGLANHFLTEHPHYRNRSVYELTYEGEVVLLQKRGE